VKHYIRYNTHPVPHLHHLGIEKHITFEYIIVQINYLILNKTDKNIIINPMSEFTPFGIDCHTFQD